MSSSCQLATCNTFVVPISHIDKAVAIAVVSLLPTPSSYRINNEYNYLAKLMVRPRPTSATPLITSLTNTTALSNSYVVSMVSTCSEARSKRITNLIVEMIAVDMRPIRIVKCNEFLRLMNFVEPGYHVPSTTHISSLIERRFTQLESKLRAKLSDEAESLSLTSDIWTSHANDSYITVSCHYVSRQWQMKSFMLSTKGVKYDCCHLDFPIKALPWQTSRDRLCV